MRDYLLFMILIQFMFLNCTASEIRESLQKISAAQSK